MSNLLRAFLLISVIASPVAAQDHDHAATAPAAAGWTTTTDANVLFGFNYQLRRYFDFAAWESQNWLMAMAEHPAGRGRVTLQTMVSLEPLTVGRFVYRVDDGERFRPGGSPQLFQTGETFAQLPLANYQHPHDLIMGLGATYERPQGRLTYTFGAHLVGSPTLGPIPFMHRESARNNPQVPLAHHLLDSTHSTAGVLSAGVKVGSWRFESSAFRGAEPDEQRYDIDSPRLDSWAARAVWQRGGWEAQFSGGNLHEPEWYAPWDQKRLTASLGYRGTLMSRPAAITLAAGQTREYTPIKVVSAGALLEWDVLATRRLTTFGRVEAVRKEVLGLHVHPRGQLHPHYLSDIGAFTFGVVQDLPFIAVERYGRWGIGGDVTGYLMSTDLQPIYGGSSSFHVFLRWRPAGAAIAHSH
jgi:hypothetical protein